MRRSGVFLKCSIVVFTTNASKTLSVFCICLSPFLYLFVFLFVFVGDEEKQSVFEMFNRCFSNKCFQDTVRKVNIAHGTSPSVGMRMVSKTFWKNMGNIGSSDSMMMIAMTLMVGNDLNWVRLMIFFSPFDGSLSSITDLQKDPSMALRMTMMTMRTIMMMRGERMITRECVEELPSSLLCLALWVLAPPQRTYN